uniref:FH2 domain-containing protein n=2 Tax=Aegilops tauschii subsp. strangulata TaxID=200361 RepID=A0A453PW59_AEGTS
VGFRLDSLLKLIDIRARNNKMTLMHYLCKVWYLISAIFSFIMFSYHKIQSFGYRLFFLFALSVWEANWCIVLQISHTCMSVFPRFEPL